VSRLKYCFIVSPPFFCKPAGAKSFAEIMGNVGSHRSSCWCRTRAPPGAASGTFAGVIAKHHLRGRLPCPATTTTHRHRPATTAPLLLGRPSRALWPEWVSPAQQQSLLPCRMYVVVQINDHQQPVNLDQHNSSSTSSFCSIDLIRFLCVFCCVHNGMMRVAWTVQCVYKGQGTYGKFYNRTLTSQAC